MTKITPTGPTPMACRIGKAFVPVIYHPDRGPEYLRLGALPSQGKAHR